MIKGNKGEWSELYVLLRLLAYGRIYAADEDLNRIENLYFPILKIIREEIKNKKYEYLIDSEKYIEIYLNEERIGQIDRDKLAKEADYLYQQILKGTDRAFEIDNIDDYMAELYLMKLSAPSTDKTDITMQIHDVHTGYKPICGFSIKSELGNPPTLLNASGATNFVYEVKGISDKQMELINLIDNPRTKIIDRINKILELGKIEYVGVKNSIFGTNLMLIDSRMEELMAEFLLLHYRDNINDCETIINKLEEQNPLKFPKRGFYTYKFKKLLCSVALGMVPSKEWDGHDEANGGYVIVSSKGDVLAYHIYNRNCFEEYLFRNTKLERGSTSRHGYATLYKEDGRMYVNLNLQIRFK